MKSVSSAIAWEIWIRRRFGILGLGLLVAVAGSYTWLRAAESPEWAETGDVIGYGVITVSILICFSFFHFTEGSRKGGFGRFPTRLYVMPVATRKLVILPMVYGVAAVSLVYLTVSRIMFAPLNIALPVVWPCAYLASGMVFYQTILWSMPQRRYLKLFVLCFVSIGLGFCWMFFNPMIIAGALSEWGYQGDPDQFRRRWAVVLAFLNLLAYGFCVLRIHQQRHSATRRMDWFRNLQDRIHVIHYRGIRSFDNAEQAQFWYEWKRSGMILPVSLGIVLVLTYFPTWLFGPLSGNETVGTLIWILVASFGFPLIIGKGFFKADFWNSNLDIPPFQAIRPMDPGTRIFIKMKVALGSVLVTWGIVLFASVVWLGFTGDLEDLLKFRQLFHMYYSPFDRLPLLVLAACFSIILSWRFMIGSMPVALSGRNRWFLTANILSAVFWVSLIIKSIVQFASPDKGVKLYQIWKFIEWLPWILATLVIFKMSLGFAVWRKVVSRSLIQSSQVRKYLLVWIAGTSCMGLFVCRLFPNTLWLQHMLILVAFLIMPLVGPGTAILCLAANRSR